MRRQQLAGLCLGLCACLWVSAGSEAQGPPAGGKPSTLDLPTFRDRVQPIFLNKRAGLARCYVCHSQGTPFRLQRLPEGRATFNEEETRKNFDAIQRLVSPGKPEASRLLLMPLAHEAGGTEFHPGGKRWSSKDDPEWKELAQWIRNASR
jgi:hypothetical protein